MRFKLPPPGTDIGWRVEFRTMELQLTDFENAAFSLFTILISRVIIAFNLNLYVSRAHIAAVSLDVSHRAGPKQPAYLRRCLYRKSMRTWTQRTRLMLQKRASSISGDRSSNHRNRSRLNSITAAPRQSASGVCTDLSKQGHNPD